MSGSGYHKLLEPVVKNIKNVVVGQERAIDLLLTALLARGHVLMEDVPGIGKTTLAAALAKSLALEFGRIQFTPDVMPSDITGYNVYNPQSGIFEFHSGAVMCSVLLADEINRSSPKTQSSLLEAMQDRQVTVDGKSYPLPNPFIVLATQNGLESLGTYPLPEAQLDRFMFKFSLGYPSLEQEMQIYALHSAGSPLKRLQPQLSSSLIFSLQEETNNVFCAPQLQAYIAKIAHVSRQIPELALGISPRGSMLLLQAAKAFAVVHGADFVTPEDIQYLAPFVLSHRIILSERAALSEEKPERIIANLIAKIPVPPAR